jgi:hypothetical protein
MILGYYIMRRHGRTERAVLCEQHAGARKILDWAVNAHPLSVPEGAVCVDCGAAKTSVLASAIDAADADAAKAEPEPVRTLPGQRSLFDGGDS